MPGQVGTPGGLHQMLCSKNTAVLADTIHFETLSLHEFAGTMLNPTTVLEALARGELSYQVWVATKKVFDSWQQEKWAHTREERVSRVLDAFLVELANDMFERVPGPHVTFIDPRNYHDTRAMTEGAYRLHKLFRLQGVPRENIVISIPATEAGILAAQRLKECHVNVNLYLVTSLLHAAACAETSPAAISIPVGNLLHVYGRDRNPAGNLMAHHGIQTIQSILAYFKFNEIKTKVIGTSFRNLEEVGLLSEFDAIGVSRHQADRLKWSKVPIISLDNVDLPAVLRGRQAKYPTELLTQPGGFLASLSPGSRNLINSVLEDALNEVQSDMDAIELFVSKEADRQFRLGTLDLKTLYKSARKKKKSARNVCPPAEADPMDEVF